MALRKIARSPAAAAADATTPPPAAAPAAAAAATSPPAAAAAALADKMPPPLGRASHQLPYHFSAQPSAELYLIPLKTFHLASNMLKLSRKVVPASGQDLTPVLLQLFSSTVSFHMPDTSQMIPRDTPEVLELS
jgi:hypothetical protein